MSANMAASAETMSRAASTRGRRRGRISAAGGLGSERITVISIVRTVAMDPSVIGHGAVLERLVLAARHERLTHALLFTGPEQVGKTTTALSLATELLQSQGWPGGPLAHADLWLEDSDAQNIHIGRVRLGGPEGPTLQDFLSLRPYAGGRRVAVMGRADRLTA